MGLHRRIEGLFVLGHSTYKSHLAECVFRIMIPMRVNCSVSLDSQGTLMSGLEVESFIFGMIVGLLEIMKGDIVRCEGWK